jgi:hypothetical protein
MGTHTFYGVGINANQKQVLGHNEIDLINEKKNIFSYPFPFPDMMRSTKRQSNNSNSVSQQNFSNDNG